MLITLAMLFGHWSVVENTMFLHHACWYISPISVASVNINCSCLMSTVLCSALNSLVYLNEPTHCQFRYSFGREIYLYCLMLYITITSTCRAWTHVTLADIQNTFDIFNMYLQDSVLDIAIVIPYGTRGMQLTVEFMHLYQVILSMLNIPTIPSLSVSCMMACQTI